jgi:hypothetical protein
VYTFSPRSEGRDGGGPGWEKDGPYRCDSHNNFAETKRKTGKITLLKLVINKNEKYEALVAV